MVAGANEAAQNNGPFARLLSRTRLPVLIVSGAIALVSLAGIAATEPAVSSIACLSVLAGLCVAGAGAFIGLRHLGLAAAVMLAPLPGVLFGCAVAQWLGGVALSGVVAAYLAGYAIAYLIADGFALTATARAAGDVLASDIDATWPKVAVAGAMVAAIPLIGLLLPEDGNVFAAVLTGVLSCAFAGAGISASSYLLTYSEDFVARCNRVHEWRERLLNRVIAVARPRWGTSVSGIALVFAVLGFFGARRGGIGTEDLVPVLAWVTGVAFAAGYAATRDWRMSAGAALAFVPVMLAGFWGVARLGAPASGVTLAQILAAGFVFAIFAVRRAGIHRAGGDDITIAFARQMMRSGSATVFCAFSGTAILLCLVGVDVAALAFAATLLFAGFAAVLVLPAVTIAVETLIPRRETIEARYRLQ